MSPKAHLFALLFLVAAAFFSFSSPSYLPSSSILSNTFGPSANKFDKLFVFGDSYADTGNSDHSAGSWKKPYGMSYPGIPTGRCSDGLVLTDFFASILGILSPIEYKNAKKNPQRLRYGMNFAFGGTGIRTTTIARQAPNLTVQISFLRDKIINGVYTLEDLSSSVGLVSVAGNDYNGKNVTDQKKMKLFIRALIDQLEVDLRELMSIGVRKIAVTNVVPFGCLPNVTLASAYEHCFEPFNSASKFHNKLLKKVVEDINKESRIGSSSVAIINIYKGFLSSFRHSQGSQFVKPLKPCCEGIGSGSSCSDINKDNGKEAYTLCSDVKSSFFWDIVHPTHAGWAAISPFSKAAIQQLQQNDVARALCHCCFCHSWGQEHYFFPHSQPNLAGNLFQPNFLWSPGSPRWSP